MNRSEMLDWFDRSARERFPIGLTERVLEDDRLDGRHVQLDGARLLNFASCSYLGLELDPRLKAGAIDAVERFGTQVSSSRAFMSAPPYGRLEELLGRIFRGHAVVTPTTTLGHLAALPILVGDRDVVLLDQYVHASVQMAAELLTTRGIRCELVRHSDLAALEERIEALSSECDRIWYMADGVYSMRGDIAPIGPLHALLDRHPQFHLYLDDAHGVGWFGRHGCGAMLAKYPLHARMVVAASMAKCFGAGGGVVVTPDPTLSAKIRRVGPTMVFGGPIQPATLGACVASAEIHLSDEHASLQRELGERIAYCNELLDAAGIPLASTHDSPIRYVACGLPRVAFALGGRLKRDGFFVNPVMAPAVPMRRAGVRFTLTLHQTRDDIAALVDSLDRNYEAAFRDCGDDVREVFDDFRLVPTHRIEAANDATRERSHGAASFDLRVDRSIEQVSEDVWDGCFAARGAFDARAMRFLERTFGSEPEAAGGGPNDWEFRYLRVNDAASELPLAAAPFTCSPWKVDMLAPVEVSRAVEERRGDDPSYLTFRALAMGSGLSEGEHLFLDRSPGVDWQGALATLLEGARGEASGLGAEAIVLRDLPAAQDAPELDAFLRGEGFTCEPVPTSHALDLSGWQGQEAWLASLPRRSRKAYRREVLPFNDAYEREIVGKGAVVGGVDRPARELDDALHERLYELYLAVKRRKLELNTFDLPRDFFRRVERDANWELMLLHPRDGYANGAAGDEPACVGASYSGGGVYVATVIGMDPAFAGAGLYRQALRHAILRAAELGAKRVDLGFGGGLAKHRLGATATERAMYIQVIDSYAFAALAQLRANLKV